MLSTQANARALPAEPRGAGRDPVCVCGRGHLCLCGACAPAGLMPLRCVHMCGVYASVGHACEKHRQGTGCGSACLVSGADQA